MDNAATRRIAEGVPNGRNVIAAPLAGTEALRDLLGDIVTKDRELGAEIMIDANNFFLQVRGRVVAADELVTAGRCGENARRQKSRRVAVDKRKRIGVERYKRGLLG